MDKKVAYILMTFVSVLVVAFGCNRPKQDAYQQPENTFAINGSVHEMNIYPEPAPEFPEHEGKAEFVNYCAICHSLKYITMQPDFSAKTWDAEVTKMIVKYKAPIDSVVSKKIVAYLVAVKGKK